METTYTWVVNQNEEIVAVASEITQRGDLVFYDAGVVRALAAGEWKSVVRQP